MAENLDVLLDDDEFGDGDGDYDIQDDEENALLEDGNDSVDNKNDDEGDILELDENVEISDEFDKNLSTSNLNEDSDEEKSRNDRFTNEREMISNICSTSKQQNNVNLRTINNNMNFIKKPAFRGGNQRGRGGRGRGNFMNKVALHRNVDTSKKVLVNPDFFRGKMNINPNGGNLTWNNRNKGFIFNNRHLNKPTIPIQPWMQNPPQQNAFQQPNNEVAPQYNNNIYPPADNNVVNMPLNYQNRNASIPPRIVQTNSHFAENRQFLIRNSNMPLQNVSGNNFSNPIPASNAPQYQGYNNNVAQYNNAPQLMNQLPQHHHHHQQQQQQQQYSGGVSAMPQSQNYHNYQNGPFQTNNFSYNNQAQFVENQRQHPSNYGYQQPQQQHQQQHQQHHHHNHHQQQQQHHVFNQSFNNNTNNIQVQQQSTGYINNQQRHKQNKPMYQNRTWSQNFNVSPIKRRVENNVQDIRKKKRPLNVGNLHQVHTLSNEELHNSMQMAEDNVPSVEEDEETIAYRKKIEEQKKIREKILRQKEERRKQAAKKLQAEEEYNTVAAPIEILKKEDVQMILPININKPAKQNQIAKLTSSHIVNNNNIQSQSFNIQNIVPRSINNNNNNFNVINTNNIQIKTIDKPDVKLDKAHINNFLNNRTIIAKDDNLIDTSIVVVNNLAAGTSEIKLRKLCQGVGDIQKLQLSSKERQATIEFKSVASAHAFYKKYQRYMLDLSMIQVTLKN